MRVLFFFSSFRGGLKQSSIMGCVVSSELLLHTPPHFLEYSEIYTRHHSDMRHVIVLSLTVAYVHSLCPLRGDPPAGHPRVPQSSSIRTPHRDFQARAKDVDFKAVMDEIKTTVLLNSQPWWPADYGTYAPFFVRLVSARRCVSEVWRQFSNIFFFMKN